MHAQLQNAEYDTRDMLHSNGGLFAVPVPGRKVVQGNRVVPNAHRREELQRVAEQRRTLPRLRKEHSLPYLPPGCTHAAHLEQRLHSSDCSLSQLYAADPQRAPFRQQNRCLEHSA